MNKKLVKLMPFNCPIKKIYCCLIIFLLVFSTSIFAQNKKYEVKVKSNNIENVKGTLHKVTAEGISVEDYRGNYYILKAKDILKIKIKKRGLTFLGSLAAGAGLGFFSGRYVLKDTHSVSDRIIGTAVFIGAGLVIGTVTGIAANAIDTKLVLKINSDVQKYEKEYQKLEKYCKTE